MSERPRTRDLLVATVNALRADDDLAAILYDDPPTTAADRQRVHPAWGGPDGTPGIEVVVEPVAGGTEWHGGGVLSEDTQLQCSVVTTEAWRDGHGILPMFDARDCVKATLESPTLSGVYPASGGGRENPIETPDESNRLLLPVTADVKTHDLTY